ncbi:hypothetical protein P43SY_001238 [Pythium insidiosum]|uniref:TRP C-terminal domain-containing protein n=1 Tax=Pythium insidiosum TaxID=114742 RepID=A0AAD5L9T6_PYTIN|nr:hypothetical protein P43SY_001238 [Pythium insidiosum]
MTLQDVSIRRNQAQSVAGGIGLWGSTSVAATRAVVEANTASMLGGGMFIQGIARIEASPFPPAQPFLRANKAAFGAGIYASDSTLTLLGVTVATGHATDDGGGVFLTRTAATWTNVTVQTSEAEGRGGGAFLFKTTLTSDRVSIVENRAQIGGGLWVTDSTLMGVSLTVRNNEAAQHGGGIAASSFVGLQNVSIAGCKAGTMGGGGVSTVLGSTLELEAVSVDQCTAASPGGGLLVNGSVIRGARVQIARCSAATAGGGVFASGASDIQGDDFTISESRATQRGGALAVDGTLAVQGVQLLSSTAVDGGAVAISPNSVVRMTSVSITGGQATQRGGGLFADSADVAMTNVTMQAHESKASGGAVFLKGSRLTHSRVAILSSVAQIGGGIYAIDSTVTPPSAMTTPAHCVVQGNVANKDGGNMFVTGSATLAWLSVADGSAASGAGLAASQSNLTIDRSRFEHNHAGKSAGGVYVADGSACKLRDVVVAENSALDGGGGLGIVSSDVLHRGLLIEANTAVLGGGAVLAGASSLLPLEEPVNVTTTPEAVARFVSNVVRTSAGHKGNGSALHVAVQAVASVAYVEMRGGDASRGGAVYLNRRSSIDLRDSVLTENNASMGGAMYAAERASVRLTRVQATRNYADNTGGAVTLAGAMGALAKANVTACEFVANIASENGGAFDSSYASLTLSDSSLRENFALYSKGGAIAASSDSKLTISRCELYFNSIVADDKTQGGAIHLSGSATATLADTTIESDPLGQLIRAGGTIYVGGTWTSISLINCALINGQSFSGGGLYIQDGSATVVNSTISGSYAYEFGSGIFAENARLQLSGGTRLERNFAYYDGGAIYARNGGEMNLTDIVLANNRVQDSGGAVFIAPGGGIQAHMKAARFIGNTNVGLGSALFIGRKNTLALENCMFLQNGGLKTGGGALYAVDAVVTVANTLFTENLALKGAAIELSRDAKLTLTGCDFTANTVTGDGGALFTSVRATATIDDTTFTGNQATNGGAVAVLGSARVQMTGVTAVENAASGFGGWLVATGRASIAVSRSSLQTNAAFSGGAVAVLENATLALTSSSFVSNEVGQFGGSIFVDSMLETTATKWTGMDVSDCRFENNSAVAGADVYWVFHPSFVFLCRACMSTSTTSGQIRITSSPMAITAGWWPETVTSGVPLGVLKRLSEDGDRPVSGAPTQPPSRGAGRRRLGELTRFPVEQAKTDVDASSPFATTLWPTVVIRDYYGSISSEDTTTHCIASKALTENDSFAFYPAMTIPTDRGYVTFENAQLLAQPRSTPYLLNISCEFSSEVLRWFTLRIGVENCRKGYENVDGRCVPCKKGTYSLDGVKCHLCPYGASCDKLDETGTMIGPTPIPAFRAEKFKILLGFFQVFGGFKKLYAIPWPSEMTRLMDIFSIGDFSLVDTSAIDCFMNRDYFVTYRMTVIVVVSLLARIESEVLAMVVRSNLRLFRARVRLRLNFQTFKNRCMKLFFWVLLLFYPELSQRAVGMFYCDEIGKSYYMSRDKSSLCYHGQWLYYLPLTVFLLIFWVADKHEYWWFEVWDLGRKLCLNCIIGLLAKTGANRIIAGLVVFLIYLSVVLFAQPFKDGSDSTLAGVTQIQLFITLFCGLILKMGSVQLEVKVVSLLTRTAFFTNVGTITFAIFSIIYEKIDATRKARRRIREEYRLAVQEQVLKLWRKAYGYALTEVYLRDDTIRPMPYLVMVELARRDREAQMQQELVQEVDRTSFVEPNPERDASVTPSQIDLDLPRPSSVNGQVDEVTNVQQDQ